MRAAAVLVELVSLRGPHPCGGRPARPYSGFPPPESRALFGNFQRVFGPAARLLLSGGAFCFLSSWVHCVFLPGTCLYERLRTFRKGSL